MSAQPIKRQTAVWLSEIGDKRRKKLERVGLIETVDSEAEEPPAPEPGVTPVIEFVNEFIEDGRTAKGTQAAPATITMPRSMIITSIASVKRHRILACIWPRQITKHRARQPSLEQKKVTMIR
jgi:hypothetical protein